MNGISMVMSKSCCPMYNFGTGSKNGFGANIKFNYLIPCRSSLHHLRISPPVPINPMLKHSYRYVMDSTYKGPGVSRKLVPYGLLGFSGLALHKAWEVVAQSISCGGWIERFVKTKAWYYEYILLGVAAVLLARGLFWNIMSGLALLGKNLISTGDKIEVADLKGEVVEMGLLTTRVFTEEDGYIDVPTPWLNQQDLVNKSRAPTCVMACNLHANIEEIEKIPEIAEEIKNVMRSAPLIYLEQEQPYCYLSGLDPVCVKLSFGCHLKEVCEEELFLAQDGIMSKSVEIIKKHGFTVKRPIMKSSL